MIARSFRRVAHGADFAGSAGLWRIILILVFGSVAHAQLPAPRLDTLFPAGVQSGTAVEVTFTGADLPDAAALIFSTPGLTATKLEALKFRVTAAPNCAPGFYEVRATGRHGISTPLPFIVGDAPELLDDGKNHTAETATPLSIPGVVHGRADSEQRDFYKVGARAGQTLHIACSGFALDSLIDPVISVRDARGATIARGDDELDRDALLTFTVPADGDYFVVVHDKLFGGSPAHYYRLAISGDSAARVALPLLAPGGVPARSTEKAQQFLEHEPNDSPAVSQTIALPAEVHGKFDTDWFAFQAEGGKALWLEVVADREGHTSDPVLILYKITRDPQGQEQSKQVLELDDQADLPAPPRWLLGSRDPAAQFVPDETATYRLRVFDRFASRRSYRLIVRAAVPDFAVIALPESLANEDKKLFKWQPNLRRGGSVHLPVAVVRQGDVGEITLRAEGLPEGVTATGVISAGAPTGMLVFHATADAKPWCGNVRVLAEGSGVSREVRTVTYRWNVENRDNQRLAGRLANCAIGIVDEAAPLTIAPADAKVWEAALGTDLEIGLRLTRPNPEAQPKGEWQFAPVGLPGLAKFDPVKLDGATAQETKLLLRLQNKDGNTFKAGTYTVWVRARGTVAYKADAKDKPRDLKHVEFSTPLTLKLTEPAVTAAAK